MECEPENQKRLQRSSDSHGCRLTKVPLQLVLKYAEALKDENEIVRDSAVRPDPMTARECWSLLFHTLVLDKWALCSNVCRFGREPLEIPKWLPVPEISGTFTKFVHPQISSAKSSTLRRTRGVFL